MKKLRTFLVLCSLVFAISMFFACDDGQTPDNGDGTGGETGGETFEPGDPYLPTYGDNIVDYDSLF